jgi:hypothetical protein
LSLTVPIWVPGVSGTFGSGSTEVSVDRSEEGAVSKASEVVTSIEFALVGRLDARWDRWVGLADIFGARVRETADFAVAQQDADAAMSAVFGRLLLGYRAVASQASGGCGRWDVDALVGFRAYRAHIELDSPAALAFDRTRTWADPLVGGRVSYDMPGPVDFRLTADVGGFGVGSDLSWCVSAQAVWCISRHFSIELGYTWLTVESDLGANDDRFLFELDVHGPELAITYRF